MAVKVYTDGCFANGEVGWGFVAVDETNKVIGEGFGNASGLDTASRNVTGEIWAALEGVSFCVENGYTDVNVCHDYIGVAAWVQGAWETKKVLTKMYKRNMLMLRDDYKVSLTFTKVKGHSGDKWNDKADKLASEGSKQPRDESMSEMLTGF